ncbi:muconolactone Delta-isomerase family protein, partial [Klebsiella pneumoniae]
NVSIFDVQDAEELHQILMGLPLYPFGNDSNLLIVFYVQIVPDDFVMQLHRF